jgi:Fe-S-cluster-containing hydrogenase component 2
MSFDTLAKKVIKCDLCDGDPLCVKFCETGAIQYVDASVVSATKQVTAAEKFTSMMQKVAAAIATV